MIGSCITSGWLVATGIGYVQMVRTNTLLWTKETLRAHFLALVFLDSVTTPLMCMVAGLASSLRNQTINR